MENFVKEVRLALVANSIVDALLARLRNFCAKLLWVGGRMDWLTALKNLSSRRNWHSERRTNGCEASQTPLADSQVSAAAYGTAVAAAKSPSEAGEVVDPFPYAADLKLAELFLERSQFGTVGREVHHFTHQMKVEARHYFDQTDDIGHYDAADNMQWFARSRVIGMRFLTLLTFALFAWFAASRIYVPLVPHETMKTPQAAEAPATAEPREDWAWRWSPVDSVFNDTSSTKCQSGPLCSKEWHAVADIVIVGALLLLSRIVLRYLFLYLFVEPHVRLKKAELRNAHAELVRGCERVAENISEIVADADWPSWAKKKGMVSLWYAIRADFLDRYFTTCLWKLRRTFVVAEWSFRSAKILIAIGIFFAIVKPDLSRGTTPPLPLDLEWSIGLTFAFVVFAVLGWEILYRVPNNFITIIFQEQDGQKGKASSSSRAGYFDALASQYGRMASLVINYKPGGGKHG